MAENVVNMLVHVAPDLIVTITVIARRMIWVLLFVFAIQGTMGLGVNMKKKEVKFF
jgi:hypothetical protein